MLGFPVHHQFPELAQTCVHQVGDAIQPSHPLFPKGWYPHLLKNFPQFVVIHTVKSFSAVNEAEVDVFQEFSFFFCDPMMLAI